MQTEGESREREGEGERDREREREIKTYLGMSICLSCLFVYAICVRVLDA